MQASVELASGFPPPSPFAAAAAAIPSYFPTLQAATTERQSLSKLELIQLANKGAGKGERNHMSRQPAKPPLCGIPPYLCPIYLIHLSISRVGFWALSLGLHRQIEPGLRYN